MALCECLDSKCPAHPGRECDQTLPRATSWGFLKEAILFRTDQDDKAGTLFCAQCRQDALASGLFVAA